jgi:hypothetical protein
MLERSTMKSTPTPHWQFSIRSMLLFTSAVAAVLAVAVRLPTFFQVALFVASIGCVLAAIFWTANAATADSRPRVAAVSWLAFGFYFSIYVVIVSGAVARDRSVVTENLRNGRDTNDIFLAASVGVMAACALVCFYRAMRAFVLAKRLVATDNGIADPSLERKQ